ncbi:hypothetical protein B9Z19DRAFT_511018 [Tuber borchii]|uniref:Transmembrane protein n=1 Tax=Tuber borchii TaxID=42251 RepID=A0A2T6ZED2_TUBBO|nr:hypothetical protein B9Z19DRAFT_511018 [Tuber borchii]
MKFWACNFKGDWLGYDLLECWLGLYGLCLGVFCVDFSCWSWISILSWKSCGQVDVD